MTALALPLEPPILRAVPRGWQPTLTIAGLAMAAVMVPTALLALADPIEFDRVNAWLKPLKFQGSVAFAWLFAAWVFSRLPAGADRTKSGQYVVWVAIAMGAFEVVYITWRASRGEASHYNQDSVVAMVLYGLMGLGAVLLTTTSLVQGLMVLKPKPAAFERALGWGLVLTFVLGTFTGAWMSAQPGHFVGVPTNAWGLPLVGWSTEVGDLRPPHFFGIHAAQFLPLAFLALAPLFKARAGAIILPLAGGYSLFVAATFVQALMGLPLIAL